MVPLLGFSPDSDPTQPGSLTDCQNLVPSEYGMRGAPAPASVGVDALAAECRGALQAYLLSGSRRLYAGTPVGLYELTNTTWTDRTRVGGYTLGAEERWSFTQYGDSTLACYPGTLIQRSAAGGNFADITGSPNARIVVAASGFAVAFNTSTSSDEWYCSAFLDETNWTLDVTTQCVKGRLVSSPGQITAAKRLGDDIIAYKENAIYVGRYAGAPAVWEWTQFRAEAGCIGLEAVIETPKGHIFLGRDDVYLFDGSSVSRLATGVVRRWLFREMSGLYASRTKMLWDRDNNLVYIYFVGAGSTQCNRCLVYHLLTGRWGVADEEVEAVVTYITQSLTYDGGSPLISDFETGPTIPYDSLFWQAGREIPSIFNTSHVLSALAGRCATAHFQTGDFGDDQGYTFCDQLRVRYTQAPTTSTAIGLVKDEAGVISTQKQSSAVSDGRHDMRQRGRFHRFRVDTTGDFHMTAIRPSIKPAGRR